MPTLQNPRQERFAQLVALGQLSLLQCYREAGYKETGGSGKALELSQKVPIASRITELRSEQASTAEANLLISRERLLGWLAELAQDGKGEMSRLKAIELLAKMQGYNEPSTVQHNHLHVSMDASLMAQLGEAMQPSLLGRALG